MIAIETVTREPSATYRYTLGVSLGLRITEVREALDMELTVLATKSGVRYDYLSKVEGGSQKNPTWKKLRAIAKGLGVDPSVITAPLGAPIPITASDKHRLVLPSPLDHDAQRSDVLIEPREAAAHGGTLSALDLDAIAEQVYERVVARLAIDAATKGHAPRSKPAVSPARAPKSAPHKRRA